MPILGGAEYHRYGIYRNGPLTVFVDASVWKEFAVLSSSAAEVFDSPRAFGNRERLGFQKKRHVAKTGRAAFTFTHGKVAESSAP